MPEHNTFIAEYGQSQGRIRPTNYYPADGEFVYVLGSELLESRDVDLGDYVRIYQTIDLTTIDVVRMDTSIVQHAGMPVARDIAAGATLKRAEVLGAFSPSTETTLKQPFSVAASAVLRVEIDGGGNQDISFPAGPPDPQSLTAQEVVNVINGTLTDGTATLGGTADDPTVVITATSSGRNATIEVKSHGGTDANDGLSFFQKENHPTYGTAIYGGDDLSAIIAPAANFTAADAGQLIAINAVANKITAIVDSQTAILQDAVTTTPTGFTAVIGGALWRAAIDIDGTEEISKLVARDRSILSNDIAVNVSKLTSTHEVAFRWQLEVA